MSEEHLQSSQVSDRAPLVLILGGARSGKSDYAQRLASRLAQRVLFVATATSLDAEMTERIARHRATRPQDWGTLEAPNDVASAFASHLDALRSAPGSGPDGPSPPQQAYELVLLDCLTLLATNVLLQDEEHPDLAEQRLIADLDALCACCPERQMALLVVSNEVGLGVVPAYPLGRTYRDLLGRANQHLARKADRVLFLVAGLAVDLKELSRTLPQRYHPGP